MPHATDSSTPVIAMPAIAKHRNRRTLAWSAGITFAALLPYLVIYAAVPQFEGLFRSFGADLPVLTMFVLKSYLYYGIGYVLAVAVFIALCISESLNTSPKLRQILFWAIVIHLILAVLMVLIMVLVMYLPIFEMGRVVNDV